MMTKPRCRDGIFCQKVDYGERYDHPKGRILIVNGTNTQPVDEEPQKQWRANISNHKKEWCKKKDREIYTSVNIKNFKRRYNIKNLLRKYCKYYFHSEFSSRSITG